MPDSVYPMMMRRHRAVMSKSVVCSPGSVPVAGFVFALFAFASFPAMTQDAGGMLEVRVPMEKVTGIGGLFFRAKDPAALGRWYQEHLGVDLVPSDYAQRPWHQEAGPTVFAPFDHDTTYFGDPRTVWMVNFRVRSLDAMAAQLRAAGVKVEVDPQNYPNGRFARLHDPEGNPIELWEPAGGDGE